MEDKEEYIKHLLYEKIAGTISEEDNLIVEEAILMHPRVRALWDELRAKMNTPKAASFLENLDENEAWKKVEPTVKEVPVRPLITKTWKFVAAAVILLFASPILWYYTSQNHKIDAEKEAKLKNTYLKTDAGELVELSANRNLELHEADIHTNQNELTYASADKNSTQWATLVVPVVKDYKIVLSDGTKVWINAASSLRFPFNFDTKIREVYLTGEAYFEVTKDKTREFIVHTDYADIRVHGTSFNVNAYNSNNFAASLIEGSVSAIKDKNNIRLKPGEEVTTENNNLNIRSFDPQEVLSWRNGVYFFHNRSLEEISQVLSRWFDVKIAWNSNDLKEQTFTGEIDKTLSIDVVISNLQLSSGIKAKLENGVLTFR
ncbi:MAG: FecR family protein [Bacteroidota bacterium]